MFRNRYKYCLQIFPTCRICRKNLRKKLYSTTTVSSAPSLKTDEIASKKYEDFPISNIRNFSIIAHIDHGKSTLADRLLEMTGTINVEPGTAQVLDRLQVEKERGITVKAVTASLQYTSKITKEDYLLNLVDTPGHVDFAHEVARSIAACQSVILLVDASQGVQAQTYSNFYLAFLNDLLIIPVLNKIDMANADPDRVREQMINVLDIEGKDILRISAKTGEGVENLLETIVDKAPPPPANRESPLKALLFDTWFDKYRGVVILVYVQDGVIKEGDEIVSAQSGAHYTVRNVGIVRPNEYNTGILKGGQVGFISCNMRSVAEAFPGDTFYAKGQPVEPFPGFTKSNPCVFAGMYPMEPSEHALLRNAVEKLSLNDPSVSVTPESSPALGLGWRLGFLGLLHMEVFNQRLDQEFDAQTITTAPNVTYKFKIKGTKSIKKYGGDEVLITSPSDMPDPQCIVEMMEPVVLGTLVTPVKYLQEVVSLCVEKRGKETSTQYLDETRVMLQYLLPLNEIMVDFHDRLKTLTSGYATFDSEDKGYVSTNLVKLDFLLNGKMVEELSLIVHKSKAREMGRTICEKLTGIIPRQQFKIAVQAAIGPKIIARENIDAYRKDVTAKLYGGDATRRMKLLRNQAEAKKAMRKVGNIEIPRDTFIRLLKR